MPQTLYTQKNLELDPVLLQLDAQNIADYLQERGYLWASVQTRLKPLRGGVEVRFWIQTGERVYLERFFLLSSSAWTSERKGKLNAWMAKFLGFARYPFYHPLAWFSSLPVFRKSRVQSALRNLENLLQAEGYLDAKVFLHSLDFNFAKDRVILKIMVREGKPYRFGTIVVKSPFPLAVSKPQGRFRKAVWESFLESLRQRLQERGYFYAKVESRGRKVGQRIHFFLEIIPGPKIYVGRILFRGNSTREDVLRRYLTLRPGEKLTAKKLRQSTKALESTGFFKAVEPKILPSLWKNARDIMWKVEEKPDGNLRFWGGFSSLWRWFGAVGFEIRNFDLFRFPTRWGDWGSAFLGGGESLRVRFLKSELWEQGSFLFLEPHFTRFLGYRFYSEYSLWKERLFSQKSFEVKNEFLLSLDPFGMRGGLRYFYFQLKKLSSFLPEDILVLREGESIVSIFFQASFRMEPIKFFWRHELSWRDWGSDRSFYKTDFGFSWRFSVLDFLILQGYLKGGWQKDLESSRALLPYPLRFFLGGRGYLRGFSYRGLAPQFYGVPLGESAFWAASLELRIPLFPKWFFGVGFVDVGDLGRGDRVVYAGRMRLAVGGGIRVLIFSLPFALDYAFPLMREVGDRVERLSFSVELQF
ncbi:MAG: hypothetical protein D6805_02965 [Planctomycetota bacterium]|nr:MAG: hypothetical protein D6805_02965 [Planctomycetota bacterium]